MSSGNQQLGFAVRAVNEASAALKDTANDLEKLEDVAKGVDSATANLDSTYDLLRASMDEVNASVQEMSKNMDPNGVQPYADALGQTEQLLNGVVDVLGVAAEQFGLNLGPMEEYVGAAAQVAGGLEGVIGGGSALLKTLGPMAASIGPVIAATWAHVAALTAQAAAFIVANAPIILIIAGLALLAAGAVLVVKHWDEIVAFVTDKFIPTIKKAPEALQEVLGWVQDHWPEVAALILLPFAPIVILATDAFGIRSKSIEGFQAVIDFVKGLPGELLALVKDLESAGSDLGTAVMNGLVSGIGAVGGLAEDIASAVGGAIKGFINSEVIDKLNSALEFDFSVKGIGFKVDAPDIPHLAQGGIVTRPTLAVVGDGGPEAVIPLNRAGGFGGFGGGAVHIHINAMDASSFERYFAERLSRPGGIIDDIIDYAARRGSVA